MQNVTRVKTDKEAYFNDHAASYCKTVAQKHLYLHFSYLHLHFPDSVDVSELVIYMKRH